MMDTFEVTVERDGRWWFAKATDLPGCHVQVRRLRDVENEIRPLVGYFAGIPDEAVRIALRRVAPSNE